MVLLFDRLYELRAEEAARGGAPVVVVGPPGAGKTTFIKQFLEARGVEAAEETAGLAPEAEEARGEGLRERAVRLLRGLAGRGYVPRDRVERELAGIRGAELLKAFDELPRSFVEHLRERYVGWSLYLFHIPPDVEEEREAVEKLLEVAKKVGVEFRWLGLRYVPPGVVAMLKEGGVGYVEEQLRLYGRILEELDAAGGRLARLAKLVRSVAEKAGESLLERFAEAVAEFAKDLLPLLHIPGAVAAGAVSGVASYLLAGGGEWGGWIRLLADWSRLDGRLRDLAAAHIALELGVGKEEVRDVLDSLSNKELEKLEGRVEELRDEVEELWDEVIAQTLAKYGDVYTRRRAEGLRVTYHKVVDAGVEYRLVTAGRFAEAAEEVKRLLAERGFVVVTGSRGIGKSTLAAYVAYDMLKRGDVDYVVKIEKPVDVSEVDVFKTLGRRALLLFDIYPREVYLEKFDPRRPLKELYGPVEVLLSLAALAERGRKAGAGLYALAVVHDKALAEAYEGKAVMEWLGGASFYVPRLNTPEFLAGVLKSYACPDENDCCLDKVDTERLVSLISSHDAYTLVAKYAGLWLRERGCDVSDVERAVEEAKREPKLFLACYIRDVLLWRSSEEERVRLMYRAAAPLLLHAYFGPVPEGVTYITQAKDGVVFYQPEEIEKLTKPQWDLLKADLQPIAKWLAQRHEDLVEEVLRDLAGLNGEEARKPYKEALGDLIERLDWARDEMLKEGSKILAELGVPEEGRVSAMALLAFVARRLAAVFKSGKSRRCWHRAALIAGHALVGHAMLPKRKQLPNVAAEALGDALEPCAVDDYLTINGKIQLLSIYVAQLMPIRELNMLTPYTDAEIIKAVKKTAEGLLARWRRGDITLTETLYALGLTALVAGGEVDGETADLLLYAALFAVQRVVLPEAVLTVLATLRPLGEKAPHRYISLLAAASELETLDPEIVWYIYVALQQLKDRLLETERRWPLVEAIRAYSNLLIKHLMYIRDLWKKAMVNICWLYDGVRKRDGTTAPGSGLSAQRLLDAVARVHVMTIALRSDVLAPLVREHCGLGDLEKEAEAVKSVLDEAATYPDELRKIVENDADFAEWTATYSPTGDARFVIADLRNWFTYQLASYKLNHALNEKGELDEKKLEEAAKDFEKAAEIDRKPGPWENYLTARGWALRARVLAAKSWEEFLKMAEGHQEPKTAKSFQKLWEEAREHIEPTAGYLETAADILGYYLVYLAASGNKEEAVKLLKERRWLLDYRPEVSVVTRLMLRVLGVGEGTRLKDVVNVFGPWLSPEFLPALWILAGRTQKDEALEICEQLPKPEVCVDTVAAAAGNQEAVKRLKSKIERVMPEASLLLDKVDGRTLVEVLASEYSQVHLAFMLLAAVEGRGDAVRLHGLWGSAAYKGTVGQPLFRAVYENCGDLNSEGCRVALLKLYYYHI